MIIEPKLQNLPKAILACVAATIVLYAGYAYYCHTWHPAVLARLNYRITTIFGVLVFLDLMLAIRIALAHCIGNFPQVALSQKGFELRGFFSKKSFDWSEVSEFTLVKNPSPYGATQLLGFDLVDRKRSSKEGKAVRTINQSMFGVDHTLPQLTGNEIGEVCNVLNKWRNDFCGSKAA